jgi:hypothetical protein
MAEHLAKDTLPDEALTEFKQLREWLLRVDYQPVGNLKLYADQNLVGHSAKLLEFLRDDIKVSTDPLSALSFRL